MDTITNEAEYKDGFNRAFWLFNYEPDVAKLLAESTKDKTGDFNIGFAEGLKQAEQEKTIKEFELIRSSNDLKDNNLEH